jgi:hypothetical protein
VLAFRKFWCILTRSTLIDAQETTKDNTFMVWPGWVLFFSGLLL